MKISIPVILSVLVVSATGLSSCSKEKSVSSINIKQLDETQKNHEWFCFSDSQIKPISLPENADETVEKPWTEAVRISSAASVPVKNQNEYKAYALLNRVGLICFTQDDAKIYSDNSLFLSNSAQSIVFTGGSPVFYLYRSTFFYDEKKTAAGPELQVSRPFLVEFDSRSKLFYPLVSYENMKLEKEDQITGCFWNGDVWVVGAKNASAPEVRFKYLWWKPPVELGDLNPALGGENFFIRASNEDEYLDVSMPKLFREAPVELKLLLKSLPDSFTYYITYRDDTGTSPVAYYHEGSDNYSVNASAMIVPESGFIAALFADGTTFVKYAGSEKISAFRLPKLPAGFRYEEFAIAGSTMYAAWEEGSSWQTKRSGFIKVDLSKIL